MKSLKCALVGLCALPKFLCAENVSLAVSATATSTAVQNSSAVQSNSVQIVIATNVTAQILHLHEYATGHATLGGYLTIQAKGLDFRYREAEMAAANNRPTVVGPATTTLTAYVLVVSQGSVWTGQDNMICAISTNQPNAANEFTPNAGVVIPADSGGPVNIILESSMDLVNWIPADPGTYGTSTTNRFFRVRATR